MFYWFNKNFLFFVHCRTSLRVHVTCFLHFNSNHHVTFPAILYVQSLDVVTLSFLEKENRWLLFGWSRPACWWLETGCDFRLEKKEKRKFRLNVHSFPTILTLKNHFKRRCISLNLHSSLSFIEHSVNEILAVLSWQYLFQFMSLINQSINGRKERCW